MERFTNEELRAADYEQDAGEVTAAQLGENMAQEMNAAIEAQEEQESRMEEIREGVGELFEDGWTAQELTAFSQSPAAQEMIAKGASVARAACAYLRAQGAVHAKKRGVPTAKMIAAGGGEKANPIETMTDEEFDAFARKARHAMMSGKKVRI